MAIKTQDWDTFVALTTARAGTGLNSSDLANINVLANAAARTINDYSQYWPRLLELQERSVDNCGNLTYSEDSYEVKCAGTTDVNGLYVRNGDISGIPAYSLFDSDGTTAIYSIWRNGADQWLLTDNEPGYIVIGIDFKYYEATSATATPPASGWTLDQKGDSPSPTLNELDDIDEVITVWTGDKNNEAVTELRGWYASADGINVGTTNYDTVFVGFKKDLTDVYGDGTNGTVSQVPFEWADYMSYSAARTLQDGRRNGEAFSGIALRQIDEVLNNQLMKVNRANAMNVFKHSLDTYFNNDYSTL